MLPEKLVSNDVGTVTRERRSGMRIQIQSCGRARVPEPFSQHHRMHPRLERQRRVGVPQIAHTDMRYTRAGYE